MRRHIGSDLPVLKSEPAEQYRVQDPSELVAEAVGALLVLTVEGARVNVVVYEKGRVVFGPGKLVCGKLATSKYRVGRRAVSMVLSAVSKSLYASKVDGLKALFKDRLGLLT